MRHVKVLHVTETAKGGVGTCINLFASFDAEEVHSHVVAPEQHASHLDDRLELSTFERPSRGPAAIFDFVRTAHRAARRFRPDIVLCHSTFSLAVAAWFRLMFRGVPIIFCPNGLATVRYEEGSAKHKVIRVMERLAYRLPSVIVHVSRAEQSIADRYRYPGRHELIENAAPDSPAGTRDDLFAEGANAGKTSVLFVGRLDRQKGFDVLVDAVRMISSERPDLDIHVVGASVNNDTKFSDLPSNFIMHGWVDHKEIDSWYRSADALVVPSRWEGLPFVVVESLRNATPALVSDRAGMPDIIEHDRTGKVFHLDAGDLSDVLRTIDRDSLRAMRPACRSVYQSRFAVERFVEEYRDLISRLAPPEEPGTGRPRCA